MIRFPILFCLVLGLWAKPSAAQISSDDLSLLIQKMQVHKDIRYLVTPTLYDRFTPDQLKSFGRKQVVRLEVPFGYAPKPSGLYWRTAFLLDAGKKASWDYLRSFLDWNKKYNGRPEPTEEWKDGQGKTIAYFEPIRNIDVRKIWGLSALYETLKNPDRLQESIPGWFRPREPGVYRFFIQGGPGVRAWVGSREVKEGDSLPLEINDYPLMVVSQIPYDPKDPQKAVWPKVKWTYQDPGGKTHDLTETWLGAYGFYCGVEGDYYSAPKPKGSPAFIRKDAFLDFTSTGDFGLPQAKDLSAKWTGVFDVEEDGSYVFRTVTNGHFKLWIDKKEILNAPSVAQNGIVLTEGTHTLSARYDRPAANSDPPELHLLLWDTSGKNFRLFIMTKKSWEYPKETKDTHVLRFPKGAK